MDLNTSRRWRFRQYSPLFLSSTSFSPLLASLHLLATVKDMSSAHTSGGVSPVPASAGRLQGYIQDRRVIGVRPSPPPSPSCFLCLTRFHHSSMIPLSNPLCSATKLFPPLHLNRPSPPLGIMPRGFWLGMTTEFLLLSAPVLSTLLSRPSIMPSFSIPRSLSGVTSSLS